jgi:hypothetical protein
MLSLPADAGMYCTFGLNYQPQIEGEFTATPGGQTNIFYGYVGYCSLMVELVHVHANI